MLLREMFDLIDVRAHQSGDTRTAFLETVIIVRWTATRVLVRPSTIRMISFIFEVLNCLVDIRGCTVE